MNFKEDLPDQCPPSNASHGALDGACRFLFFSPPECDKNYFSHAELGKRIGNATECKARSCSLFKISHIVKQAAKIGIFKNKKIAILNIPEGSGAHLHGNNGHIDFWLSQEFSPSNSIKKVVDSPEDAEKEAGDA